MVNRMPKYIDADALEVVGFTDRQGSFSDGVQWLLEYIDKLPSADVQPVRHGHWIRHIEQKNIFGGKCVECSECGEKYVVQYIEDEKCCRNCGARMDGEQNDTD